MPISGSMYTVGKIYPRWKTGNTMTRIEYQGDSMIFIYGVPHPTKDELSSISNDSVHVAFSVVDDFPFILLSTDSLGWMDAPFYPNVYPPQYLNKQFRAGEGLPFFIFLVDTATGQLVFMRMCGLSSSMSNNLFSVCRELSKLPTLDYSEQGDKIKDIYRKHPTSKSLLSHSKPEWATSFVRIDSPSQRPL